MAQLEQAAGGSDDTVIAAEPTIEDRFAAFAEDPQEEEDQQGAEGDDAPETQADDLPEIAPEDVEAEDAEEGEPKPIDAPVSWTAEEKEEFTKLPRAMQETLSRRESEREKFLQSKSQEVKQTRVHAEQQALELIQRQNTEYTQALQMLLPEVPEKPSYALQAQNPQAFAEAMDAHENAILVRTYISQELQKVGQVNEQQENAVKAQLAQLGQELLQEKFPEYLDPEKGPELRKTLQSTARALGYSDEQLAQSDAHDVIAMKQVSEWKAKADKFDTIMSKQMQRVREGKNPPKITRPGAPQGRGQVANQRYESDRKAMRDGDRGATDRVFDRFV